MSSQDKAAASAAVVVGNKNNKNNHDDFNDIILMMKNSTNWQQGLIHLQSLINISPTTTSSTDDNTSGGGGGVRDELERDNDDHNNNEGKEEEEEEADDGTMMSTTTKMSRNMKYKKISKLALLLLQRNDKIIIAKKKNNDTNNNNNINVDSSVEDGKDEYGVDGGSDNDHYDDTIMSKEIQNTIRSIYIKSLIKLNLYTDALSNIKKWKQEQQQQEQQSQSQSSEQESSLQQADDDNDGDEVQLLFIEEESYCYYRLHQYNKCKLTCEKYLQTKYPIVYSVITGKDVGDDGGVGGDMEDYSSSSPPLGLLHVYAQCLYRMTSSGITISSSSGSSSSTTAATSALRVYAYIQSLSTDNNNNNDSMEEEKEEILTNLVASCISCPDASNSACQWKDYWKKRQEARRNSDEGEGAATTTATPPPPGLPGVSLVGSSFSVVNFLYGLDDIIQKLMDGVNLKDVWGAGNEEDENEDEDEEEVNYDLAYNVATAMALHARGSGDIDQATNLLKQAEEACRISLVADGATNEVKKLELAPIQCNLAYSQLLNVIGSFMEDDEMTMKLCEAIFAKVLVSKNKPAIAAALNNVSVVRVGRACAIQQGVATIGGGGNKKKKRGSGGGDTNNINDAEALLQDALKRLPEIPPPPISEYDAKRKKRKNKKKNEQQQEHPQQEEQEQQQIILTQTQIGRVLLNKAIVLYHLNKNEECFETLKEIKKRFSGLGSVGGSGGGGGVLTTVDIMESCLLEREGKLKEAEKALEKSRAYAKTQHDSFGMAEIDLHLAQQQFISLLNSSTQDDQDMNKVIDILEGLEPDICLSPAVTSTLVDMYLQQHSYNDVYHHVTSCYSSASSMGGIGNVHSLRRLRAKKLNGDYKLYFGMYEEAANVYEDLINLTSSSPEEEEEENENVIFVSKEERLGYIASLVQALSYFDVDRAHILASSILPSLDEIGDGNEDGEGVILDGEELENMELPRSSSQRIRKLIAVDKKREDRKKAKASQQKNQEARLRQRAKKRLIHLQKLEKEGKYNPNKPPQQNKPDPERWIPKKQRSYNKQHRGGGRSRGGGGSAAAAGGAKLGGVQGAGAGTERDAMKLDAAARAAARKQQREQQQGKVSNMPRSTAHINVSSSTSSASSAGGNVKRGGRRR